jgi:long-subunit acyl-CoA synthetase (AMP-forming)
VPDAPVVMSLKPQKIEPVPRVVQEIKKKTTEEVPQKTINKFEFNFDLRAGQT